MAGPRVFRAPRVVEYDHGREPYDEVDAGVGSGGSWASNAFRFFLICFS
jgi:hypothetical protein